MTSAPLGLGFTICQMWAVVYLLHKTVVRQDTAGLRLNRHHHHDYRPSGPLPLAAGVNRGPERTCSCRGLGEGRLGAARASQILGLWVQGISLGVPLPSAPMKPSAGAPWFLGSGGTRWGWLAFPRVESVSGDVCWEWTQALAHTSGQPGEQSLFLLGRSEPR